MWITPDRAERVTNLFFGFYFCFFNKCVYQLWESSWFSASKSTQFWQIEVNNISPQAMIISHGELQRKGTKFCGNVTGGASYPLPEVSWLEEIKAAVWCHPRVGWATCRAHWAGVNVTLSSFFLLQHAGDFKLAFIFGGASHTESWGTIISRI